MTVSLFFLICGSGSGGGAKVPGSEERGVETGDFETEVAGGGGVGNAATEGDGGGAANASVLEHLETCRMYWSLRITVWLQ